MHCYGDRKQSKGTGIEEFSLFFYIADTGPYGDCAKAVHEAGGKAASCRPCDGNAAQIFDQKRCVFQHGKANSNRHSDGKHPFAAVIQEEGIAEHRKGF